MLYITEKFDVLCGRLLGNHNDFHWQLGVQINHQPCSCKAARVIRCTSWTALFRAFSSHRQPSASLLKGIPQLNKTLGQTGQTFGIWFSRILDSKLTVLSFFFTIRFSGICRFVQSALLYFSVHSR